MLNQKRTGTRGPGAGQRAMPQQRALRLARRAQRRRGDGSRGPLARRAWRILAAAADGGDRSAISAVYRSWLRAPDEETWKLLSRWRAPSALAADVLAAAADPGRPAGQRALLGAFCARHGLAPEQDGPRALFHVLTGQAAQHRAADPDGTLLAAAYRAAEEPARAAVREALAEAGDLDLARAVLVARDRDRVAPQAGEERRYLARQLADHRDWAGLWRLAKELPLAEAVTATRLSGDGWRPRDQRERALFEKLAHARPETIAAVAASGPIARIKVRGRLCSLHFAPDNSEVVAMCDVAPMTITSYALPSGQPGLEHRCDDGEGGVMAPRRSYLPWHPVHLGDVVIHAESSRGRDSVHYRVVATDRARGNRGIVWRSAWETAGGQLPRWLVPALGGFIVADRKRLRLGTAAGPKLRDLVLPVPPGLGQAGAAEICALASDPASGRLAILTGRPGSRLDLTVLDAGFQMIGRASSDAVCVPGRSYDLVFCGPDRLLTSFFNDRGLCSWRVGPDLAVEAMAACTGPLKSLPLTKKLALTGGHLPAATWLNALDLTPAEPSPGLPLTWLAGISPDGARVALQPRYGGREVEIYDPARCEIAALLARPLADARPGDLHTLETAGALDAGPEHAEVAGLLRACLEHRFGADVGIGRSARNIGDDEIGISRGIGGRG